jgi:hypothetical protein
MRRLDIERHEFHPDWNYTISPRRTYLLSHDSEVVVSAAILSLAHTARVNRSIDKKVVIPALQALATDSRYVGKVQVAVHSELYSVM